MKKIRTLSSILFLGTWTLTVTVWGEFDDLNSNARNMSMGGALTALAEDVPTVPINPAGLGYLRRAELASDYGRLFLGLEDNSNLTLSHFAIGIPLMKFNKAIESKERVELPPLPTLSSITKSTSTEKTKIDKSSATSPTILLGGRRQLSQLSHRGALSLHYRRFSLSNALEETTWGISWGKSISSKWNVGLSLKNLQQKFAQDEYTQIDPVFDFGGKGSVSGFSVDTGFIYNVLPRVFLGASFLDINEPDLGLKETSKVPRTHRIGLGYKTVRVKAGLDGVIRDDRWTVGSGFERTFSRLNMAVRSGFKFGEGDLFNFNLGFGFMLGQVGLDYGFQFPISGIEKTDGSHRASLVIKFGQPLITEAEPGSLEHAYLEIQTQLKEAQAKLAEVEGHRDSLENVLVEEATQRIQERIKSERKLAKSRAQKKQKKTARKKRIYEEDLNILTHRIKKGDTLQSLSDRYYGAKGNWRLIYEANKKYIGRGGSLKKGQTIIIPPLEESAPQRFGQDDKKKPKSKFSSSKSKKRYRKSIKSTTAELGTKSKDGLRSHRVKRGESLQSIAKKYYGTESEWRKIYQRNKDQIIRGVPNEGATLVIP